MKYFLPLIAALWSGGSIATAQAPCANPPAGSGPRFFIEPTPATASDTVVATRLCLVPGRKGLGSYMATIGYDSTRTTAVRVETTGGMQAANARAPGIIRIAGASPGGFSGGVLATIRFSRRGARAIGPVSLVVTEASTPAGASVTSEIVSVGWPAAVAAVLRRPGIDSISPRSGEVDSDRVTDIVLYGKGFAPSANIVMFAGAEVTGLLSERNGTVLRFAAPTKVPAKNGVAAHRIEGGRVEVRVRHAGGTSNAVTFTVKDDDR
jgi:hypothetical protein